VSLCDMFHQLDSSQVNYQKVTRIRIVDDYALGRVLGEGSYAKVKEGVNTNTKSLVAIKIFSRVRLRSIENGEIMVQREVSLMRGLNHQNIVHVLDDFIIEEKEKMYIVMEYVNGGTLHDLLEHSPQKKLPMSQAQFVFKGLIKGIIYLQHNGIVHRDLKPDNILVRTDFVIKIADFGTAFRITPTNEIENCQHGEGSPAYQPPENTNNNDWKKNPMKFDIWSAGVILYVTTIGKYPFENPNPMTLFANISKGEYVIPNSIMQPLSDLIRGMLQVDAEKRLAAKTIKKHPWVTMHHKENQKRDVIVQLLPTIFDPKTVDEIMKSVVSENSKPKEERCLLM